VDGGRVFVEINMQETDDMYSENIREEVEEKLESMKCIQEIIVRILERGKFEMKDNGRPAAPASPDSTSGEGAGGI
jgi:hypothetical protein